ncbi:MAG TPA: ABC transporter permease subunit [Candidatus Akkermansia intestinavium]|nr:ABC transporter permease subunit [Candidatus Akkermansia intestinavium]
MSPATAKLLTKKNLIALLLLLAALLGGLAELCGWLLPTLSWPFTVNRELPFLGVSAQSCPQLAWLASPEEGVIHWFGWLAMLLPAGAGIYLLLRSQHSLRLPPEYRRRLARFRSFRRGYWSLLVLLGLLVLAGLDQCVVGKRALFVSYEGHWYFPAFTRAVIPGEVFGLKGEEAHAEAPYRKLAEHEGEHGMPSCVIMPPVPYDPTMDAVPFPVEELEMHGGRLCDAEGKPVDGQVCRLDEHGQPCLRMRYRRGLPDGLAQGWSADRREVYSAHYEQGRLLDERYVGEGSRREFLREAERRAPVRVYYHPAPPLTGGHLLGTTSQGADMLAYLYGGLQVNIKAALFYLPVTYAIGLTMGMLMGYIGGKFDLLSQRVIELLCQLPFLFVVMVVSDLVPLAWRGTFLMLSLLSLLGWMHMSYLIRAATLREKTREYVAAARVMGAGSLHILHRHILPNLTSIIVTLVPFSVAGVILSLASLDYLGFGVPDTYASWGRLLNEGLARLSSPWLVSCAFGALVLALLLVTFIGEAIREAYDPRRYTYYE